MPAGAVLDGEFVVWEGERTNFSQLQRRVTAGAQLPAVIGRHPAHYVVFDLLRAPPGRPLLDTPLIERRALLGQLLAQAPAPLTLSPQTTNLEQAVEWLHTWTAAGIEGLMIKRLDGRYESGRRGCQRLRAYRTMELMAKTFTLIALTDKWYREVAVVSSLLVEAEKLVRERGFDPIPAP